MVQDITKLLAEEAEDKRPTLASEILRESVAIVVADDVISPKERAFVSERLAPSLTVAPQEAQALLKKASGRLSRSRAYVERAFEIFMMIADLEERPPQLNTAEGDELPGFLGAVDRFVIEQRAASSRVVAYFLGAVGGIFWVEEYQHHIAELGELAQAARNLRAKSGVEARLHTIQHELGQLRNRGVDPNGFRAVARHVTNVLGKMQGLTDAQRDLFRDHVAPALELDYGTLLKTSAQRRSMIDLHNNLVGRPQAEEPESQRWWQFWK